jgi:imidazolonepropionase-like amidohydrolase
MTRTVFANANLLDGEHPARAGSTVVIEDDRITSVGSGPLDHDVRPDDRVVDLAGRTLMPGMVTGHFHSTYRDVGSVPAPLGLDHPPAYLAYVAAENAKKAVMAGYTGAVGASCAHDVDASLAKAIREGMLPGPRLVPSSRDLITTGDANDVAAWHWDLRGWGGIRLCDGPDEFRKVVRDEIKRGADIIKLYVTGGHGVLAPKSQISCAPDEVRAAVDAAHGRGKRVRAHVCTKAAILDCVDAGVDILDHADDLDRECIDACVAAGTFVLPSIALGRRILDNAAQGGVTLGFGDALQRELDAMCALLPEADAAGLKIATGDDYGAVGFRHGEYSWELGLYVKLAGMAPIDVLRWATKNGAELMGRADELGTIEAGKLADLLVVDGDPSQDISRLEDPNNLLAIVQDGKFVKDELAAIV